MIQHATPFPGTNQSPAELLMGRRIKTNLDKLHPTYSPETPRDSTPKIRTFQPGDSVYARNYSGHPLWLAGTITEITGSRSYKLELGDGQTWRCHIDQLRDRWRPRTQLHAAEAKPNHPDKSFITGGPNEAESGGEARSATRGENDLPPEMDCVPVLPAANW